MTKQEFTNEVINEAENRPSHIRYGQAVFNYIDAKYGVARILQFEHRVDCFYKDDKRDCLEFIDKAYEVAKKLNIL